jgi:hypothetical protein
LAYNDGNGKFTSRKHDYRIGGFPYSILYEDLNGDGENEIITGNNAQLSISILHNYGNGSFAPFEDYSFADHHPFGLDVGDMDGDGDIDILCANYGVDASTPESSISIVWNNGNGTFSNHTDYEVGSMPIRVKASDIDLDGDLDIVVSNYHSNTVTILTNHDNKTFGDSVDYQVGPLPMCVDLSDLNEDGYPDIITTNQDNDSLSIMYNKGNGKFEPQTEYPIGAQPIFVTITDLNNDGALDIATANLLSNSVSVRLDLHFPKDISMSIGASGAVNNFHKGMLDRAVEVSDFASLINGYLEVHKGEAVPTPQGPMVNVPLNFNAKVVGVLDVLDLEVVYETYLDTDNDNIPDELDTDDDNDNLPDTWEDQYGLDPINPLDREADEDNDGLVSFEEFLNSTDPTLPDHDFDGLSDGDEVMVYHTSPITADTDGDGFDDGDEVDEGTDPLDENDTPPDTDSGVCFTPGFGAEIILFSIIVLVMITVFSRNKGYRGKRL